MHRKQLFHPVLSLPLKLLEHLIGGVSLFPFHISVGKAELEKVEPSLVALCWRSVSHIEVLFRVHFSQGAQSDPLFFPPVLRPTLEREKALILEQIPARRRKASARHWKLKTA